MRRVVFINDKKEIDITEKKAIIWGAEIKSFNEFDSLNVYDEAIIVDNDETKWGKYCIIKGKIVEIYSPEILRSLNSNDYYILVLIEKYKKEIKKQIAQISTGAYLVIDNITDVIIKYDEIEDLLCNDYYSRQKLINLRISDMCKFIHKIKTDLDELKDEIESYVPIKKGHKLCIKCIGKKQDYVLGIKTKASRGVRHSWNEAVGNPGNVNIIEKAVRENRLLQDITFFEDEEIYIQKCCFQNVDFSSDEIRKSVLIKIAELHDKKIELDIKACPFDRYTDLIVGIRNNVNLNTINKAVAFCEDSYGGKGLVLSHGDCHHGNIVFDGDKCILIDWECLCYTYEYYDVCRFLFYSQIDEFSDDIELYEEQMEELYNNLPKYVKYYKNSATDMDIDDSKKMLYLCEAIELALRINRGQGRTDEMVSVIEKHFSLIKK